MKRLTPVIILAGVALTAYLAAGGLSRGLTPETLRRSSFAWNQEELEYGFANWQDVFPGREVRAGRTVRELPEGPSLEGLPGGTGWADELDRFMTDQKVAGLIVVADGTIRLERYGLGHSPEGRWVSQSVAKAMTSTLVGAAVKDGFIQSIDEPVTQYIADLRGSAYDSVTIRQLMTMTSGVRWNEDYSDPNSDISRFYADPVEPGLNATVSYMRRLPRASPPGTAWVYKTGETHLLGVLVSSATGQTLSEYLSSKIWGTYGMEISAYWSTDATDHELGGCCVHAGLRDYARFGLFVLEGGVVDGASIAPDGWFEEATTLQVEIGAGGRGYGYQWWTYGDGSFSAIGIHGQLIHIDPARQMVIAVNSAWPVATGDEYYAAQSSLITAIARALDGEAN